MICPSFLNYGYCEDQETCTYQHPQNFCEPCGRGFPDKKLYDNHLSTFSHGIALRAMQRTEARAPRRCTVCDVRVPGVANRVQHSRGANHVRLLRDLSAQGIRRDESQIFVLDETVVFYCEVCETMEWNGKAVHERSRRHKSKIDYMAVRAALEEGAKNKYGVSVSYESNGVDFGIIENTRSAYRATVDISLDTAGARIRFVNASLTSSHSIRSIDTAFEIDSPPPQLLSSSRYLEVKIDFLAEEGGRYQDRAAFTFLDLSQNKKFVIIRSLVATIGSKEDYELLRPVAPYVPRRQTRQEPIGKVVEGERPPALAEISWVVELGSYDVPKPLQRVLDMDDMKEKLEFVRQFLPRSFTCDTYARQFRTLLHTEEHKAAVDLQRYDNHEGSTLESGGNDRLYYLQVPGLAEKRPSIIIGDRILVKHHGESTHWWSGYVHKVRLNDVGLKFNSRFNSFKGQKWDVRFTLGRLPLRRMHQALDASYSPARLLFPFRPHILRNRPPNEAELNRLRPINSKVGSNKAQRLAVTAIKDLQPGSPPFIVFGPPGTGKTVTIIESIRQLLAKDPDNTRILVVTPSNSAADLVAERLKEVGKTWLFRMNAPSRSQDTLPKSLLDFSRTNDKGTFYIPPAHQLMAFRVVISTCISSSIPYGIGVPRGHFTHIFMDEAGQATEPEAMIVIKTMANDETNVILSGDPKQLGPIVRSDIAVSLRLGVSYLDRLCEMDIYEVARYTGITIVKLTQNFRSHPSILKYPNDTFYGGELTPHADPAIIQSLTRWDDLGKAGFPVIFHGICGKDQREASSPSFFNIDEASVVKSYIQALKIDQRLRLKDEHFGIIAPYNAQVSKIRTLLQKVAPAIKVGSVEEFQGQERRVIIVSTVRSTMDYVLADIRHTLGFVANPRRFNVAMTRAQALLIVVGDPRVLSLDPLWRGFLNYIYNSGGWKGSRASQPDWDTTVDVDDVGYDLQRRREAQADEQGLVQRILDAVEGELQAEALDERDADGVAVVERPWREAE